MRYKLYWVVIPLVALFIRGFAFFKYDYPTGADYGHHTYFAELYMADGELPTHFPFYQLGHARWSAMPGGSLTYALISAFSGRSAFEVAAITAVFSAIEAMGIYLLAWRIFRRFDAAYTAGLVVALLPAGPTMVSWAAYANLISLALIPYALVTWLDYWQEPNRRRLFLAVITICGTAAVHHLSTSWFGLALLLFSATNIALQPLESIKKLLPLAVAGAVVGCPVLLRIVDLSLLFETGNMPLDRFDPTRINWSNWSHTASAAALVFLFGGMLRFLSARELSRSARVLIGCYLIVSLLFAFGWFFGLSFYYARAIYFLSLPIALGAAAFVFMWRRPSVRALVMTIALSSLGTATIFQADATAEYYERLTPGVMEGVEWLLEFSQPGDVVVVGTALGFHMPRLLRRPTMVALTSDLIGNPEDVDVAADAVSVLMGLHNMDHVLQRRNVKFIVVRAHGQDVPDPYRSRAVLSAHPHIILLFANMDILIYGVEPF